jgi:rare lipoprotein A
MLIRDFVSCSIDTIPVQRVTRGKIVSALATCLACAVIGGGSAVANTVTEFELSSPISPALPADINSASSNSFDDRFAGLQISLISDIFKVPLEFDAPELLTTGSLPQPEQTASLPQPETENLPPRLQIIPAAEPIVGIASTYNPTDPTDLDAGNEELASGERYDVDGWSAAIRTDLRKKFGGVRFGRNYVPAYALVESGDKKVILKINDVGPLRPGRIIDFNIRAMRYFDPTLQLGLIHDVKVTYLEGTDWALGPVIVDEQPVAVAGLVNHE